MAREDLRGIVRYIGKDNPTRAKRFGKDLRDKTRPLARHPELGRPGRLPGMRELVAHSNYIVFLSCAGRGPQRADFESETSGTTNAVVLDSNASYELCTRNGAVMTKNLEKIFDKRAIFLL